MSTLISIIATIVFIYFIYYGYKWFRYRHNATLKHQYKKKFWISIAAYLVLACIGGAISPSNSSSNHQASNRTKTVAYHNNGNPKQNFKYFKNHAIHKFGDWTTTHPADKSNITTPSGAKWSKSDEAFIIDTGADAHSTADKHTQTYDSFTELKRFMKKYEPISKKSWDGTVEFQDNYGDTIATSNVYNKHLDDNGMGFDGDED